MSDRPGPAALSNGLLAHQSLQATTRHRRQTRRNHTHHNARGHPQPPAQNARSGAGARTQNHHDVARECRTGWVRAGIYTRVVPKGKAFVMSLLATVLAQRFDHDDHMGGGGWWLWGMLMMIVVLAAIGVVIWLIVRSVHMGGGGTTRSPRDVLNDRYARGEIDTEDYEERISRLR